MKHGLRRIILVFSDIDGYTCFRLDRCKRRGGGVCVYVKSNIEATRVNLMASVENAEYMWINCVCLYSYAAVTIRQNHVTVLMHS